MRGDVIVDDVCCVVDKRTDDGTSVLVELMTLSGIQRHGGIRKVESKESCRVVEFCDQLVALRFSRNETCVDEAVQTISYARTSMKLVSLTHAVTRGENSVETISTFA